MFSNYRWGLLQLSDCVRLTYNMVTTAHSCADYTVINILTWWQPFSHINARQSCLGGRVFMDTHAREKSSTPKSKIKINWPDSWLTRVWLVTRSWLGLAVGSCNATTLVKQTSPDNKLTQHRHRHNVSLFGIFHSDTAFRTHFGYFWFNLFTGIKYIWKEYS